jgi:GntR family transcriptional regulator
MRTPLTIDAKDPMPIYAQLERAVRNAIASGALKAGEKLPTVRQLAVDLRINANTVAKVYLELERAGVVETRRGVGTFISESQGPSSLRDRKRELSALSESYLLRAKQLGFRDKEILDYLTSKLKEA